MALVVQKFGGSSVATAERIMRAARRAIRAQQDGRQVIVVVSARGDTTDELVSLARELSEQPPAREMDMLMATGEQISIALMAIAIQSLGHPAISFTGAQIGIVTDSFHTKARIKNISTARIRQALDEGKIAIVAGFQGIDEAYNITTLGRGGSDTTAVALAAVMKHAGYGVRSPAGSGVRSKESEARGQRSEVNNAGHGAAEPLTPDSGHRTPDSGHRTPDTGLRTLDTGLRTPDTDVGCEIYTDVDGVYTTDPRVVPEARKVDVISYDEMLELASVGAGVMHSRSIEFAKKFDVPLQVRSSFTDNEGTWIVPETDWMRGIVVCGAAITRDEARVSLQGVPDEPGISHRVFSAIAEQNVVVDMIGQNVGKVGKANIGFTVLKAELATTLAVLRPLAAELGATVEHEEDVSKVSIVGTGMRTHTGVAERMFAALAEAEVNMKMITTGDIKISVLVGKEDGVKALRAVHQAFHLHEARPGAGMPAVVRRSSAQSFRRSTMDEGNGDNRTPLGHLASMEEIVVSDVLLITDQGRITVSNLPDQAGNCSRVFQAVATGGIVVDLIVQNLTSQGRAELSFSVPLSDLEKARKLTQEAVAEIDSQTSVAADPNIAKLFVLGVGMRTHTGVARQMFGALAERNINISMINTSEVRVSVVVERSRGEEALACLKAAFHVS